MLASRNGPVPGAAFFSAAQLVSAYWPVAAASAGAGAAAALAVGEAAPAADDPEAAELATPLMLPEAPPSDLCVAMTMSLFDAYVRARRCVESWPEESPRSVCSLCKACRVRAVYM